MKKKKQNERKCLCLYLRPLLQHTCITQSVCVCVCVCVCALDSVHTWSSSCCMFDSKNTLSLPLDSIADLYLTL